MAAVWATGGGKAVAEDAFLEARPAEGQGRSSSAALATEAGSTVVLRRCELRCPVAQGGQQQQQPPAGAHRGLQVEGGGRATAADCTCSGPIVVLDQGSSLLHSGLAFPPGLARRIITGDGGVARELPAPAGSAAGGRAGTGAPLPAPPEAGSQGKGASD
jgi:hypothetical protein